MAIDDQKTLEQQMLQIQQDQVKRSMGVGAPGTPTSVTPPPFRGAGTIAEPKSRFPALKTESYLGIERPVFEKETKPLDLGFGLFSSPVSLGIDLPTDVKVTIADPAKITPALRIQQVMNFDNPKIVTGFEKSLGVRNKNGKELYFREDQGYAERLDAANRFGATSIIKEDGNLFKIPWENKIYGEFNVKIDISFCMTQMGIAVDSRSTNIDRHFVGKNRVKFFFCFTQRIINM